MIAPSVSDVDLRLPDGRTFTIRYSIRAQAALQKHFGLPSLAAVGARLSDGANLGVDDIVALLWAGLRTHHPEMGLDDAMEIADDLGPAGLMAFVQGAFGAAAPPPAPGGEPDAPDRP